MAKIIKHNTSNNPAVINALKALWFGGFLKTPSYAKNTKCPPSKTGIGNRFIGICHRSKGIMEKSFIEANRPIGIIGNRPIDR